ncbi:hypothetical protein KCP74_19240 [Salmonella enterica subsp. enterica]|nr:hypothetical protein KCP74_19240 [Salmonella enterica subsp. enterica]
MGKAVFLSGSELSGGHQRTIFWANSFGRQHGWWRGKHIEPQLLSGTSQRFQPDFTVIRRDAIRHSALLLCAFCRPQGKRGVGPMMPSSISRSVITAGRCGHFAAQRRPNGSPVPREISPGHKYKSTSQRVIRPWRCWEHRLRIVPLSSTPSDDQRMVRKGLTSLIGTAFLTQSRMLSAVEYRHRQSKRCSPSVRWVVSQNQRRCHAQRGGIDTA